MKLIHRLIHQIPLVIVISALLMLSHTSGRHSGKSEALKLCSDKELSKQLQATRDSLYIAIESEKRAIRHKRQVMERNRHLTNNLAQRRQIITKLKRQCKQH